MEFHDILHGLIRINDENLSPLLTALIASPEIHRLRNMRQMNFDVPLIQELGRSRRLPHSIGVTHLAISLAHKSQLNLRDSKVLLAAAMLHDAAIPPYGHLVESEFKHVAPDFDHEKILESLINGTISGKNIYEEAVPTGHLKLKEILIDHNVEPEAVLRVVCPKSGKSSPISADIDIDNIDNIHRMAAMLGWDRAKENMSAIISSARLDGLNALCFSDDAVTPLETWLDFRQRIYTMIIAHPECIPYNALQADLARAAVKHKIITPEEWHTTEPEFEEKLRSDENTAKLARQLISGCQYQLIDYVWLKNFTPNKKLKNAQIAAHMSDSVDAKIRDPGYFVWYEKGLISRQIKVNREGGARPYTIGKDSTSCLIALVKKSEGKPRWAKSDEIAWRKGIISAFVKLTGADTFDIDYPETYTGRFNGVGKNELQLGYN